MAEVGIRLGAKLKALRKDKDITTQVLADSIGVSQAYISQIERNQRVPSTQVINKLVEFFNVPYGFLVTDDAMSIAEYKARETIRTGIDPEKYKGYYIVLDRAIDNHVSPDELNDYINLALNYRNRNVAEAQP